MNTRLLDQFLTEECTPYVRQLLKSAIEEAQADPNRPARRFEFSRFEVTLDLDELTATIEDVLDPSEAGACRVPLRQFVMALDSE